MRRLLYTIFIAGILLAACTDDEMLKPQEIDSQTAEEVSESSTQDSVPQDTIGDAGIDMPINKDRGSKPGQTKLDRIKPIDRRNYR